MGKTIFIKRSFLNKPGYHSNATLLCDITDNRDDDYSDPFWGHYKITDCDNKVNLAIDFASVEELNNTLHKLDKIISITQSFRDAAAELKPKIKEYIKKQAKKEASENLEKAIKP